MSKGTSISTSKHVFCPDWPCFLESMFCKDLPSEVCWSDGNEAKHARATLYTECSWDQWGGTAVSPPVLPQFVCKTCVILSSKIVGVFLSSKIVCVFLSSELVANLLPSLEIAKTTWQLLAGKPKTRLSIEHNVSHPWYNNFVHLCNHFFVFFAKFKFPNFFYSHKVQYLDLSLIKNEGGNKI